MSLVTNFYGWSVSSHLVMNPVDAIVCHGWSVSSHLSLFCGWLSCRICILIYVHFIIGCIPNIICEPYLIIACLHFADGCAYSICILIWSSLSGFKWLRGFSCGWSRIKEKCSSGSGIGISISRAAWCIDGTTHGYGNRPWERILEGREWFHNNAIAACICIFHVLIRHKNSLLWEDYTTWRCKI